MPGPEVYASLAMDAAGVQAMLGDLLGRLGAAGVEVDRDIDTRLRHARATLQALGDRLTEQAHQVAMQAPIGDSGPR